MRFPSPNYTQTPNELLDEVLPEIDSLAELKVTLVVARQTLGWHQQAVPLTLTTIQRLTGLARSTASRGVQAALERGTVIRQERADGLVYALAVGAENDAEAGSGTGSESLPLEGDGGSESLPLTGSESLPPRARGGLSVVKERVKEKGGVGAADRVWAHYVTLRQASPQKIRRTDLDPEARRMINAALKVASEDELLRALSGLFASEHHLGQNDRGKAYLGLEYVLKARGDKTTRARIDQFLDIAEKVGVTRSGASVDPARLSVAKRNVLDAWEFPGDEQAKKAGEMSAAWLAQHGYRVDRDPETGRPTFHGEAA